MRRTTKKQITIIELNLQITTTRVVETEVTHDLMMIITKRIIDRIHVNNNHKGINAKTRYIDKYL